MSAVLEFSKISPTFDLLHSQIGRDSGDVFCFSRFGQASNEGGLPVHVEGAEVTPGLTVDFVGGEGPTPSADGLNGRDPEHTVTVPSPGLDTGPLTRDKAVSGLDDCQASSEVVPKQGKDAFLLYRLP